MDILLVHPVQLCRRNTLPFLQQLLGLVDPQPRRFPSCCEPIGRVDLLYAALLLLYRGNLPASVGQQVHHLPASSADGERPRSVRSLLLLSMEPAYVV